MQLETWSRRKRMTPSSKLLHRISTRLSRTTPCLLLLALGAACLITGLLTGAWLHRHLGSSHIYCTSAPHFASSQQDVACEAWDARQHSVVHADEARTLPAHCRGIPYLLQISQDLAPWMEQGISESVIQQAAAHEGAARFVIHQGQLYSHRDYGSSALHARYSYYVEFLHKLLCSMGPAASALTVDFVVNLKDECRSPVQGPPLPVMGPHKSAMFTDILFPFPEFYRNWDGMVASMRHAAVPWEAQQDLLVWRGSQTGGNFTADTWQSFPRARLVLLCRDMPTLCDAAWSEWTQVDEGAKAAMTKATGGLGSFISLQDQQRYRYVASLDGNGWATRFAPLLASSSVVFKQTSPWFEFFYIALRPYEHYVPLSAFMDDVAAVVGWARNHTDTARRIVANANAFVERWLTTECLHCYVLALLLEYQGLQRFNASTSGAVEVPHVCHAATPAG